MSLSKPPLETTSSPPVVTPGLEKTDEENTVETEQAGLKCTITQDALLNVVTQVMKAVDVHASTPILSHVLVTTRPHPYPGASAQVTITSRNTTTTISIQCDAEVEREGMCTIPARALLEGVKTFSKGQEVTVEAISPLVHIQCEKRIFKLKGGPNPDEFLLWSEMTVGKDAPFAMDTDIFRQAIKEVHFAAEEGTSRPVLNAVCLHLQEETLTLAALDSFRMNVRTVSGLTARAGRDTRLLLPVAAMRLLAEVLPPACPVVVMWDKDKTQAVFQAGRVQVAIQLVEGTFPNYQSIIPKEHRTAFLVSRKALEQTLKALKIFAQDNANVFTLSYHPRQDTVGCHARSETLGEAYDEINVPVEGADGQISFHIRYLLDVLKHVHVDAFVFELGTDQVPALMLPQGREDYVCAIMPMSRHR